MSECIEWTKYRTKSGYGKVTWNGQSWYAHRKAWAEEFGEIPTGLCVCHMCDNPGCINTEHLFLGTQADNVADMIAKGRSPDRRLVECKRGHPLDEENTLIYGKVRKCRKCHAMRTARWRKNNK